MAHARANSPCWEGNCVDRVVVDGWRPADAAKAMGVSRQTAYKWLRRFRDEGQRPRRIAPRHPSAAPPTRRRRGGHHRGCSSRDALWASPAGLCAGAAPFDHLWGLRRERISRLSFMDRPTRTVVRYERTGLARSSTSTSKSWAGSAREADGGSTAPSSASRVGTQKRLAMTTSMWRSTITVGSPLSRPWPTRKGRGVPQFPSRRCRLLRLRKGHHRTGDDRQRPQLHEVGRLQDSPG